MYDYLAYYLPCSKETLVKRAKTLMIEDQVNQLDAPMKELKEGEFVALYVEYRT